MMRVTSGRAMGVGRVESREREEEDEREKEAVSSNGGESASWSVLERKMMSEREFSM